MGRSHRGFLVIDPAGKAGLYQAVPMAGWDVIGTVTRNDYDTGALVRNQTTGVYCQANAGVLRSLPQAKVLAALRGHGHE